MCRYLSAGFCSVLLLWSWFLASAESGPSLPNRPFAPASAETLYYDDGFPESHQSITDAMCEKMPAPSFTPYPFDIIAVLWNALDTTPFELHIWDDDGAGGTPGTNLLSQSVNPPNSGWFEIAIAAPVTIPDGQFYVGCLTQVGIGFDETDPDYDEAYVDFGLGWDPLWWYGPHGDFLIRAIIEQARDVGVTRITAPDTLIEPNQPLQPEAWVKNFGRLDQDSFPVWCLIDSIDTTLYTEVDTVLFLASGDSTTVLFPTWTPDGGGNIYEVTVYTALAGDQVPENDTLVDTTQTILHDTGVDSIAAPADTVFTGFSYEPIVSVRNLGDVLETFDVTCTIDGYEDTLTVMNLGPGSAVSCTFNLWTVPWTDSATYTMTVRTWLAGDEDPSNDALSKPIFAYNPHDVGIDAILSPPDSVWPDSTYPVQAVVCNYGEVTDSFDVLCWIDGIYAELLWVAPLPPDSCRPLSFPPWWAAPSGPWDMCCATLLDHDRNTANDTLCKTIYPRVGTEELPGYHLPAFSFQLRQNTPNPLRRTTTITYTLPPRQGDTETRRGGDLSTCQRINLSVYDLTGTLVRTLVDGHRAPGLQAALWDARDEQGRHVAPGIYFCQLRMHNCIACRKMVLLK